ncbi:MAG: hypothetical protein ACP5OG_04815 [Candidatus Nanoarchaeia archaeon]
MKNKKAGEKYLSFWLYFNWIVIALALVIAIVVIYSVNLNSDTVHSEILSLKVSSCIKSINNPEIVFSKDFDLFKECEIEKEILEKNYYLEISIKNNKDKEKFPVISYGVADFKLRCMLKESGSKLSDLLGCSQKQEYLDYNGGVLVAEIFAASENENE